METSPYTVLMLSLLYMVVAFVTCFSWIPKLWSANDDTLVMVGTGLMVGFIVLSVFLLVKLVQYINGRSY